jgi:hypothetical protein
MEQMSALPTEALVGGLIFILVLLGLLIWYYRLMLRAVCEMLRYPESTVLQVFGFLGLLPFPLIIVLGIMVMTVWHRHKSWLIETGQLKI